MVPLFGALIKQVLNVIGFGTVVQGIHQRTSPIDHLLSDASVGFFSGILSLSKFGGLSVLLAHLFLIQIFLVENQIEDKPYNYFGYIW